MQLILRHQGRERVVREHLESKHLTENASPHLLDDIEYEMRELERPQRSWTSVEILEREG